MKTNLKLAALSLILLLSTTGNCATPALAEDWGVGKYMGSWGVKPVEPTNKKIDPPRAEDRAGWKELDAYRGTWLDKILGALGKWFGNDDLKKDDSATKVRSLNDDQILKAKDNYKSPPVDKRWDDFKEGGRLYPGAVKMQGATRK